MKKISYFGLFSCFVINSMALSSCDVSSTSAAEDLLNDARSAVSAGDYEKARKCIDSLRVCYPREFDARREALAFEDTLNLYQAKHELAIADSVSTFAELELADLQSKFVLEKNEKYQSEGFYVLPKYAGNKSRFDFFPEVEESGKMLLVSVDKQRKYTFTDVAVNEEEFDEKNIQISIPSNALQDVKECYRLALAFSRSHDALESKEKQNLKVRFFEKKIQENKK